jgi:hypothetical protein
MKAKMNILIMAASLLGMVALFTGCQTTGKTLSSDTSDACPICNMKTSESPISGLTYTKHVCPECKTVSTIDPAAPASMKDYVDPEQQTIHVCDHCEAAVSKCPLCREE